MSSSGFRGVKQTVYLDTGTTYSFYVYVKNEDFVAFALQFIDKNGEPISTKGSMINSNEVWTKIEFKNIKIPDNKVLTLMIGGTGSGTLSLDEASFVPDDNIDGVRKEYYALFEEWDPKVIRYPGGWFADIYENYWEKGIGDIDKRAANIYGGFGQFQRLDFGTDEFLKLCDNLDITPHIVVNYNRTPQDAANWIEYCNGDTNTTYGNLRKQNGHPEPYGIFFWEVGNEQWGDEIEMSNRYLLFYDEMKKADSSAEIMVDGNLWAGKENFDKIMTNVGKKCQVFGWHYTASGRPKETTDDLNIFKSIVGRGYQFKGNMSRYPNWLEEYDLIPEVLHGNTEWWIEYGKPGDWLLDTAKRASSLEAGLSTAAHIMTMQNFPEYFRLAERTIGLGCIRTELNEENGNKEIFGTSQYQALKLFSNFSGTNLINSEVAASETFSSQPTDGLSTVKNIPYIQVSVTESSDSLYLAVLNADHENSRDVYFHFNEYVEQGFDTKMHYLHSDNFLDANTYETPEKVRVKSKEIQFSNQMTFPKHSVSIISLPKTAIKTGIDSGAISNITIINNTLIWKTEEEIEDYRFYDYLGNSIELPVISNLENEIWFNISKLSTGAYFLKWQSEAGEGTEKFIK